MSTRIFFFRSLGSIIPEYYRRSPQENIGRSFHKINPVFTQFSSMEELLTSFVKYKSDYNVIVLHAADLGVIMDIGKTKGAFITDEILGDILEARGAIREKKEPKNAGRGAHGIEAKYITNLARITAKLGERGPRVMFRGCNIGQNPRNLRLWGKLLGAFSIDGPKCDQLYVRIKPKLLSEAKLRETLGSPTNSKDEKWSIISGELAAGARDSLESSIPQMRTAMDKLRKSVRDAGTLAFKVTHQINLGNMTEETFANAWMTKKNSMHFYGHFYNKLWYSAPMGPASNEFIAKILWDDKAMMMWFPVMDGFGDMHTLIHL